MAVGSVAAEDVVDAATTIGEVIFLMNLSGLSLVKKPTAKAQDKDDKQTGDIVGNDKIQHLKQHIIADTGHHLGNERKNTEGGNFHNQVGHFHHCIRRLMNDTDQLLRIVSNKQQHNAQQNGEYDDLERVTSGQQLQKYSSGPRRSDFPENYKNCLPASEPKDPVTPVRAG